MPIVREVAATIRVRVGVGGGMLAVSVVVVMTVEQDDGAIGVVAVVCWG